MLKDEDLRKKYDMYGEDGLKEDGPSGGGYKNWNFYKQDFGEYTSVGRMRNHKGVASW